jgi:hypothetical protein
MMLMKVMMHMERNNAEVLVSLYMRETIRGAAMDRPRKNDSMAINRVMILKCIRSSPV